MSDVMTATEVSNVELAKNIYAAFARGDIPAVLASFDPALEWREGEGNPYQPDGSAWIGPETVVQKLFISLATEWDGFAIHLHKFHDAGDYVVMEGRASGTYKPTGRTLDAQACHVLRFRNQKMVSFQQYGDIAQLQAVMGAGE